VRTGFEPDKQQWELYQVTEDFSQANDLAAQNPQKLRELQDLWWAEAAKYKVVPLDWRAVERLNSELMGRPSLAGKRTTYTYYPGQIALPNDAAPGILNRSWSLTADVQIPASGAEGMVVTHGGLVGGYGLYIKDGKPTFVYNYLAEDRPTFTGSLPFPMGKVKLKVDLTYTGKAGELGKAATLALSVNGTRVAGGQLDKTIPIQISLGEGMDIGEDVGSPVDFNYKLPFKFTGTIDKVTIELK
jgi:arylsulfatase